jgi:hypothetical protein
VRIVLRISLSGIAATTIPLTIPALPNRDYLSLLFTSSSAAASERSW